MDNEKRLIEVAFPLKQASLDSVHEKNVRHGHISTLHIWPARRPLAACRAALIATLLPDPGDPVERKKILERLGGKVVQKVKRKKDAEGRLVEEVTEETEGGILHWGRESGPDLDWFREKIREAYGGRAPKVLDPFAGGGAIPLEAMRLGCEATAVDINPVAWFILKCTLEYPQKLAGQKRPLPDFAVQDREFMEEYLKAQGFKGAAFEAQMEKLGFGKAQSQHLPGMEAAGVSLEADLAWHVRAWGKWVLKEARKKLAAYYPTYADFEPLVEVTGKVEHRPMQLVPLTEDGTPNINALNAEFSEEYLMEKRNPRWVAKPTVAYLWARTVTCKNCRATIPLLKTRWLCKKDKKRVVLTMSHNTEKNYLVFDVKNDVPIIGKNSAERRAHDNKIGGGTMSRSGAICPCCGGIMTTEDIRFNGKDGQLGSQLTSVVYSNVDGKGYRVPTELELTVASVSEDILNQHFENIPFGLPNEMIVEDAKRNTWCVQYGLDEFQKLYTQRQLIFIATMINNLRQVGEITKKSYKQEWVEAIHAYLAIVIDRVSDRNSALSHYDVSRDSISGTFQRFALPVNWDFAEAVPINHAAGSVVSQLDWVVRYIEYATSSFMVAEKSEIINSSSISFENNSREKYDAIITDPPYYDAIGYSVLMDYFYIWLKRSLFGMNEEINNAFSGRLAPKWDHTNHNGELVDDASRFNGNREASKRNYEEGMSKVFGNCSDMLKPEGRLVIVFAHKQPDAWETLVTAILKAGFVVDGSWPIQTEMGNRTRALSGSALSSSVWLVCKKRNTLTRPGWDNKVLEDMRANITTRLRDFWDAGIRGPDFVWAATGPAMEAYSKYPVVKKANKPGEIMTVSEFLKHVRRMVVDFVVGRVLSTGGGEEVSGLDNITTYYLLHRHDFGLNDAPAGPCILYAVSCGLSDKDLADRYDLLARSGGSERITTEDGDELTTEDGEAITTEEDGSGSAFRLKPWSQRKRPDMGYDPHVDSSPASLPLFPDMEREIQPTREIPLIDQVHRLMHLWKGGDVSKVNEYLDLRGLRRNPLFHQLLQALIELAAGEERSLLESISNHVGGKNGQSTIKMFNDL